MSHSRRAGLLEQQLGDVRVLHLPEVGSTSTRLRELAGADRLEGPTLLIADWQTAGRGTRTRTWFQPQPADDSPPRDLALTFAAPLDAAPDPRLSLAVGAILADALSKAARTPVYVKWPNDLLAGDPPRKAGGILLETIPGWLLVGVGLNVNSRPEDFPPDLAPELTTLSAARGRQLDVGLLQLAVGKALAQHLPAPDLDAWTARWLELDRTAGTRYTLIRQGRDIAVTARHVDSSGALTLVEADGAEHVVRSYTELERS